MIREPGGGLVERRERVLAQVLPVPRVGRPRRGRVVGIGAHEQHLGIGAARQPGGQRDGVLRALGLVDAHDDLGHDCLLGWGFTADATWASVAVTSAGSHLPAP
jgi:hypothetical protein